MRVFVVPALLLLAVACDDARRPGGSIAPPSTRVDAAEDAGASADADPTADALEGVDAPSGQDAAEGVDAQIFPDAAEVLDAQPFLDAAEVLDAQPFPDAQTFPDAQPLPDAQTFPDGGGMPAAASAAIAAARALPNGPAGILVDGAVVTLVRPQALGNDPPGFSIQADQAGPALWIALDPTTLTPPPALGDRVRLTVDTVGSNTAMVRLASAISGYTRLQSGVPLAPLVQDVTNATDLVSGIDTYELELVRANVSVASGFRGAGSFFQSARVETNGIFGEPNLEVRMPTSISESLGLGFGCTFTVQNPLWRFEVRPQFQAFTAQDLQNLACPPARLVIANAPADNRVILSFDRPVSAASINANGSQFTFNNGLRATAARVAGGNVILTTITQTAFTSYTVTVAGTVIDARGSTVDPNFRSATFSAPTPTARLEINEVNANITGGCDLVELRVTRGGSLDGWTLRSRDIVMVTFGPVAVSTNQLVVVHATGVSSTCNPGGISGGELFSPSELPRGLYSTNYDTAFDWYSGQGGIVNTDTVLTLLDGSGNVVDAVLLSDDAFGTSANASEDAAMLVASVGEWYTSGGGLPLGGYVDDSFCSNAVTGLNQTGADALGFTLQRTGNTDTNSASDWISSGNPSWGSLNSGQSPF